MSCFHYGLLPAHWLHCTHSRKWWLKSWRGRTQQSVPVPSAGGQTQALDKHGATATMGFVSPGAGRVLSLSSTRPGTHCLGWIREECHVTRGQNKSDRFGTKGSRVSLNAPKHESLDLSRNSSCLLPCPLGHRETCGATIAAHRG
jgi:hypothetical protein